MRSFSFSTGSLAMRSLTQASRLVLHTKRGEGGRSRGEKGGTGEEERDGGHREEGGGSRSDLGVRSSRSMVLLINVPSVRSHSTMRPGG